MDKMYTKPQYKCAICGTIYDDLKERVKCESTCIKKQEEEAKKAEELKKKAEQETRHKEVVDAYNNFHDLLKKYIKDYGTFSVNGIDVPTFSKLIDHFWF